MLEGHQSILGSMNYQQRALNLPAILFIVKDLLQHRPCTIAVKVSRHFFERKEGRQQHRAVNRILLRDGQSNRATNRPTEQNELVTSELLSQQEFHESLSVLLNVLGVSLSLEDRIASILHCQ